MIPFDADHDLALGDVLRAVRPGDHVEMRSPDGRSWRGVYKDGQVFGQRDFFGVVAELHSGFQMPETSTTEWDVKLREQGIRAYLAWVEEGARDCGLFPRLRLASSDHPDPALAFPSPLFRDRPSEGDLPWIMTGAHGRWLMPCDMAVEPSYGEEFHDVAPPWFARRVVSAESGVYEILTRVGWTPADIGSIHELLGGFTEDPEALPRRRLLL